LKHIAILGSTGSVGKNALLVAKHLGCSISSIAAHSNIDLLEKQARQFQPQCIAVFDRESALELKNRLPHMHVVGGSEGVIEAATIKSADIVISATTGIVGMVPTLRAIEAGKTIGLANKELLVAAGELIMRSAHTHATQILPVDSEHSAIFQCLQGRVPGEVRRVILTASGGPFHKRKNLEDITPSCALRHPIWMMGKKITIDSSTLMNKGLEAIGIKFLFDIPYEQIKILIHPQGVMHSCVEFVDGALLAQMGEPDMKIPIQYMLTYPERKNGIATCFDFLKYPKLEFCMPDLKRFPCLNLALQAAKIGGTLPCFMSAANDALVSRFLRGAIRWQEIGKKLEALMSRHRALPQDNLELLLSVDRCAREMATNA